MKILMIGGTRFVGAHVARRLHDAGNEVVVFHRGRSGNRVLPELEHVLDPGAEYPVTDFPDRLRRDWDVVVHMVAMGGIDAGAAVRTFRDRAQRLVVISSLDVYRAYGRLTRSEPGPLDPVPLDEDAPLRTVLYPYRDMVAQLGTYARDYDKTLVEAAVRSGCDGWTILRLPKVYGPEDNGDLATVYGFAAEPAWRWTHGHVENVAAAIALCATHPSASDEIFNVGEEVTPTMGERLARLLSRAGEPPRAPSFDYRQPLVTDSGKIRRLLGYQEVLDEGPAMGNLARAAASLVGEDLRSRG